jgi:hypothetical protein
MLRRRQFNLALVNLSKKLDFCIVDIDRILKRTGVQTQMDWAHPDPRVHLAVAQDAVRIITDLGVLH